MYGGNNARKEVTDDNVELAVVDRFTSERLNDCESVRSAVGWSQQEFGTPADLQSSEERGERRVGGEQRFLGRALPLRGREQRICRDGRPVQLKSAPDAASGRRLHAALAAERLHVLDAEQLLCELHQRAGDRVVTVRLGERQQSGHSADEQRRGVG